MDRGWLNADSRVVVEYEYQAYLRLGRMEKAEMLRSWLEKRGAG